MKKLTKGGDSRPHYLEQRKKTQIGQMPEIMQRRNFHVNKKEIKPKLFKRRQKNKQSSVNWM